MTSSYLLILHLLTSALSNHITATTPPNTHIQTAPNEAATQLYPSLSILSLQTSSETSSRDIVDVMNTNILDQSQTNAMMETAATVVVPSTAIFPLMVSSSILTNNTNEDVDNSEDGASRQASVILVAYILPGCIVLGLVIFIASKLMNIRTRRKLEKALQPKVQAATNRNVLSNKYTDL